jgi:hypothetical protein
VVILGPTFPYIMCHDLGWVSLLILVGPWFRLGPRLPWEHDWPGLILLIAFTHLQHWIFFGESTYPSGLPLRSLPLVSLGFRTLPMLWAISGQLRW